MGIPYSKQINSAFDQVTPLVGEGFKVLETTKNISILLAVIQVLTVLMLMCIQATLIILLFTCNPDLERERKELVSPALRWFAAWILERESRRFLVLLGLVVLAGVGIGGAGATAFVKNSRVEIVPPEEGVGVGGEGEDVKG